MPLELFFVLFAFCSTVCSGTILIKFGRVAFHFRNLMNNMDSIPPDPLENFGLHSRQFLCDAVVNAKQSMFKYTPSQYERGQQPITSLTSWNVLDGSEVKVSINYQRIHDLHPDPDEHLQYQIRTTTFGSNDRKWIKSMQCVNEMTVKWFVTFGLVDEFMYLLEPGTNKRFSPLRITGIFDPMPIVDDRSPEYFYQQFRSSKGALESLCNLGADDQLRLCSAILVLLSPRGSLMDANYLAKERHSCIKNVAKIEDEPSRATFLRCTIFQGETPTTLFHVLAVSNVREAVFVFKEGRTDKALELYTRVTKVGSLMNPVGHVKKKHREKKATTGKQCTNGILLAFYFQMRGVEETALMKKVTDSTCRQTTVEGTQERGWTGEEECRVSIMGLASSD